MEVDFHTPMEIDHTRLQPLLEDQCQHHRNWGFEIYGEVLDGRHGIHYEYKSGMVALRG